jgi:hypothetical protein
MVMSAAFDTELAVARGLASGALRSPQTFCGATFAVLCIAEPAYVRTDGEVGYRDWLSDDRTLERMVGLPIVGDDRGMLGSDFNERVIGSIILPFRDGHRLMAVARLWRSGGAERAGLFARVDDIMTVQNDDGTRVVVEHSPRLIDHIRI